MTQMHDVLAALKQGRSLTPLEALREFGCFRLGARVHELREAGWPIHRELVHVEGEHGPARVARYSLPQDRKAWPEGRG
jgi:hypothetical protein